MELIDRPASCFGNRPAKALIELVVLHYTAMEDAELRLNAFAGRNSKSLRIIWWRGTDRCFGWFTRTSGPGMRAPDPGRDGAT